MHNTRDTKCTPPVGTSASFKLFSSSLSRPSRIHRRVRCPPRPPRCGPTQWLVTGDTSTRARSVPHQTPNRFVYNFTVQTSTPALCLTLCNAALQPRRQTALLEWRASQLRNGNFPHELLLVPYAVSFLSLILVRRLSLWVLDIHGNGDAPHPPTFHRRTSAPFVSNSATAWFGVHVPARVPDHAV